MFGRIRARLVLLVVGFPLVLPACSNPATENDFRVGATREELLSAHGDPARKQTLEKRGQAVWGAIEAFWPRVAVGSSVEIWAYPVQGGTIELYFIDDSEHVQGKGFAPGGAVFEAGP